MKTILKIWLMGLLVCTVSVHADHTGNTDDSVDESGYYDDDSDTEVSPSCDCASGNRDDSNRDSQSRDIGFGISIGGQNGNGLNALLAGILSGIMMGNNNNNSGPNNGMIQPGYDQRYAPAPYDGRYYQAPAILPLNGGFQGGNQTAPIFAPYMMGNSGAVYNGGDWWMNQQNSGSQWNMGPAPAILPMYQGQGFNQAVPGQQ